MIIIIVALVTYRARSKCLDGGKQAERIRES